MNAASRTDSVCFTTRGQVVIPSWLRKQFDIEDGTRCVVQSTKDGILLKPVTAALIRRGRGLLKAGAGSFAEERAAHKKNEKALEDRHAG